MRSVVSGFARTLGTALVAVAVLAAFAVAWGAVRLPWGSAPAETTNPPANPPSNGELAVELVPGQSDSLLVPEDVQRSLGIRKGTIEEVAVARWPTRTRPLVMPGSTALDPARLIRLRVRFAPAELVEMGTIDDPHSSPGNIPPLRRDLQVGDAVKKGELLAVLFSADVGNKKEDLFDALCQLRLDEAVLARAEAHSAAVPEVFLLNARRSVQGDLANVSRAENTLRTWAIPPADIQSVRDEVRPLTTPEERRAGKTERFERWARVELRAPENGFIIEQNVALHETVVDNTTNLFQIAKVDPLIVLAAVPEDDLPALQQLKGRNRDIIAWTVCTVGTEPVRGLIDDIGYLIDPNQHTAVVRGHIPNPKGVLRAGQFVTATVQLLPPSDVVEVPIGAVVEDGTDSVVFVQTDPQKPVYTMRRVQVTNRFDRTAYVRSVALAADALSSLPIGPLRAGERVLTTGALELKTALASKLSGGTGN